MTRFLAFFILLCAAANLSAQGTRLLRQPTLSADKVAFVYANDLWIADRDGGDAIRLTSNEGEERFPHFSPDGSLIAFTGEYDGNDDVFVVPAEGGEPRRLTWHPGGDIVQGWTPDGRVLFRSGRKGHPTQTNTFYTIGLEGGPPEMLGVPRAAYGEVSPDGERVAYVPITSWDPEWRNYRGGQAMPIWIVDLETLELTRAPQADRERHLDPVWVGEEVFFLSERDYASNIWAYNPLSGRERQLTFHSQFDVKSVDAYEGTLVYEQGGYLHLLDAAGGEARQLEIHVRGDMNFARARWEDAPASSLANARLSPTGQRALFEYRGEIFSVPRENGAWRNLSNSPGTADRYPVWSPLGDKVAWFSDASGEYQLMVVDQKGLQDPVSYAIPDPTFFFEPVWSGDGKYLSFTDTDYNIWVLNLDSGEANIADTDRYAHPDRSMNPIWSPDSKWIAYARQLDSHFKAIFAYHVETGERIQLTDGMADASSPAWDENGKFLYFLASTDYGLNSGWLDMSSYDPGLNRHLYALVLSAEDESPLMPKSDEEEEVANDEGESGNDGEAEEDEIVVRIDPEGLQNRLVALDVPERTYVGLRPGPAMSVFFLESVPNQSGLTLHKYDLEEREATEYMTGLAYGTVSHDRQRMLVRKGSTWSIIGTGAKPSNGGDNLRLNLRVKVDPMAEYKQIFREGWRIQRDFLYVDNVHGAPWDDIYDWYAPWVDHVRHRTDMNYVMDILSGEVAVGHSYVGGGDLPDVDRVPVGLLGADYVVENNQYRLAKIYNGESWNPDLRAPLAMPGLDVSEGDYILAVNGVEISGSDNIYRFFEETAGRPVILTVNANPDLEGARDLLVEPIANESGLRRFDWIESNRRKVNDLSDGKVAYVYVPNTGGAGFEYFNRYYFAQQDKKGVVIDERNNGGGSAADYMIDIMDRKLFGYFNSKANDRRPWTTPMAGIWGPKVMIINERAGSGGDLLPYMFRAADLGPLVGTRTWGGLVGTWDTPRFIDGGYMIAPRGGFFDADGQWAVEGEGVAPDIEVIQDPKSVMDGHDPQLERAVEEALRLLETQEVQLKPEPPAPVRWKRPENR